MDTLTLWFLSLAPPAQATFISALVSTLVVLLLAAFNPLNARRLERIKSELHADLEHTRAELAQKSAVSDARTSYEFDARRRLYVEVEPLFFLLFEAAEGSYYRVASLVRTNRQGNLGGQDGSWLARDGYYLRSTIFRLFLPLAIFRLIQRSATFVDIRLDQNVRTRYFLLKLSYYAFTDDFEFAGLEPKLNYSPNVPNWREMMEKSPEQHSRQGLVIGHLDRLLDALIIDENGSSRPMNYGEFETQYKNDVDFQVAMAEARTLLFGFNFHKKPVFARALLAHAYSMRLLLLTFARELNHDDLVAAVDKFRSSQEAAEDLEWGDPTYREISSAVGAYVGERLSWLRDDDYELS